MNQYDPPFADDRILPNGETYQDFINRRRREIETQISRQKVSREKKEQLLRCVTDVMMSEIFDMFTRGKQ